MLEGLVCVYVCVRVCVTLCLRLLNGSGNGGKSALMAGRGVDLWLCGPLHSATTTVARGSHASRDGSVPLTVIYSYVECVRITSDSRVVRSPA